VSSIHDLYRQYHEAGLIDEDEYRLYTLDTPVHTDAPVEPDEHMDDDEFFFDDEADAVGGDGVALSPADLEQVRAGTSEIPDRVAAERLVDSISALMVSVATGGPRIDDVNAAYQREYRALAATLKRLGIGNPNPFDDLWRWYGRWSDGTLPTWASRRAHVADMYAPTRSALEGQSEVLTDVASPTEGTTVTGWAEVDRRLGRLRQRFREADDEDAYNAVALQAVKLLATLGRTVFDPTRHLPPDQDEPKLDDAKRRVGLYVQHEAPGKAGADLRRLVSSAFDLAQAVKHRHKPSRADAGIVADAAALIVSIVRRLADAAEPESDNEIPF
jgi:hypothetical protein